MDISILSIYKEGNEGHSPSFLNRPIRRKTPLHFISPLPKLPRSYNIKSLPGFEREKLGIARDKERGISYPRDALTF